MAKAASLAITLVVLAAATSAHAQFGGEQTGLANRAPYDAAIRCFVANAIAKSERERAGDRAKVAYYDGKAKEAFGVAYVLGDGMGLSRPQIDADFERARREQLPAMKRDQAYFYQVVGHCKAVELM